MNVWRITAPRCISMEESQGVLREGCVKIKVTKLGLTSADIALFEGKSKGKYPMVPGRIATGMVSEMNAGSAFRKGERVLLSPYFFDEKDRLKVMGVDTNGYLADFVVVPESVVYKLPEVVADEHAIFAEYIALSISLMDKLGLSKQQYVTILGANALGLIFAQLAIYYQAIPIIVDKSEKKLAEARKYGIYYCIDSDKEDVHARIKQITCGKMAEATIFECRSAQQPQLAFSLTAEGCKVGIVGYDTFAGELDADISAIMGRQLSVIGVSNGAGDMGSAINLLANKVIKVDNIIDKYTDFNGVLDVMNEVADNENNYLKVLVKC